MLGFFFFLIRYCMDRLFVYKCPWCGGEAYNGDPYTGGRFRGSAKCFECNKAFSAIHETPISKNGPPYVEPEWTKEHLAVMQGLKVRSLQRESAEGSLNTGMKLISFQDWLLAKEASPHTRSLDAFRKGIGVPVASIYSRSTPPDGDELEKKLEKHTRKKKRRKKGKENGVSKKKRD